MGTSPSPSSQLALTLVQPEAGAPSPSMMMGAELDEELQCVLVPLHQGVAEVDDSVAVAMDLSFLESMATGVKEM